MSCATEQEVDEYFKSTDTFINIDMNFKQIDYENIAEPVQSLNSYSSIKIIP